jgi:hypothetical protein
MLDRGGVFEDVGERGKQRGVQEHGIALGLLDRVSETIFSEGIVGSDEGQRLRSGACSV